MHQVVHGFKNLGGAVRGHGFVVDKVNQMRDIWLT
jgi:hypothetical protein